eukprot:5030576-Pyramimonas_sp.AAC.1
MIDLPVGPHRPVKLTFKAKSGDQKVRIAKKSQAPPGTRVVGPVLLDPDMSEPDRLLDEFFDKAGGTSDQITLQGDNLKTGIEVLNKTCATWNDIAWQDVTHVTGYDGKGFPGGSPITWMTLPVRKVLMT